MSMEHAPEGRRNLYAGFPQMGTPAGLVLANLIFLATNSLAGHATFTAWAWRVPFLLSFVLVGVGLVVRLRVTESPSFDRARQEDEVVRFPLADALKAGLPRLAVTLLAVVANSAVAYVFMVFTLSYGTKHLGFDQQFLVLGVSGAAVLWFVSIPVWTRIADRKGRRTLFIGGSVAILLWCAVFFPLLDTGNRASALLALAGMGLIIPVTHCVQGAIIADTFPVRVRYSGTSLVLQIGAVLGGGLAPMISSALLGGGSSSTGVTWYLVGMCALSLVGAVALFRMVPETPVERAPLVPETAGKA